MPTSRDSVVKDRRSGRNFRPKTQKRRRGGRSAVPGDGGDERDRTADLLVANQALSQLSYIPTHDSNRAAGPLLRSGSTASPLAPPLPGATPPTQDLVGLPGFEPGTSRLSGARSHQLSYRPGSLARASEAVEPRPLAKPLPGISPDPIGNRKGRQTRCGKFYSNRARTARTGRRPLKYQRDFM